MTSCEFPRTFDIQLDSFLAAGHNMEPVVVEDNSMVVLDTGKAGETAVALVVGSSPRSARLLR